MIGRFIRGPKNSAPGPAAVPRPTKTKAPTLRSGGGFRFTFVCGLQGEQVGSGRGFVDRLNQFLLHLF